jgi:hypothetical protein
MSTTVPSSCARVRARLVLARDGGLAPLVGALDRGHLEACTECQHERTQHERLLASIRALSVPRAADSEFVSTAVLERLSALRVARRAPRWSAPAALVAAAAAVLLFVLLASHGAGPNPRSVDLASLDRFVEQLPSWSDVVRGLHSLSRRIS